MFLLESHEMVQNHGGRRGRNEKNFPAVFASIKELIKVLKGSQIKHTAPPYIVLNDNVILKPIS